MTARFTAPKLLAPAALLAAALAPQLGAQTTPSPPLAVAPAQKPDAAPPAAPDPQPRIYLSPDGTTVYLIGSILDDSFKRFDAVLAAAPGARTLYLSSPGGLTIEARLIAAEVRKRRLNTYVEQYCASACTQIFVAGRERVIGREASLGFHQAVGVDRQGRATRVNRATDRALTPTVVFDVNGNDTLRLAYELAGIDKAFITKVLAKNHEEMWNPTVKELTDAHVITRQAEKPEFTAPEGSMTQAELRAVLAKRPIWDRAAKLYPEAYATGFGNAWRLGNSGTAMELAISSGRAELIVAMMGRVARASDSVVDRHLALYAQEAQRQAQAGYPVCQSSMDDSALQVSESTLTFERAEDLLLVEALDGQAAYPVMASKDAMKVFVKDIAPLLPTNFGTADSCKSGFEMMLAINKLTGSKRIKAYRAMLSLPDAMGV